MSVTWRLWKSTVEVSRTILKILPITIALSAMAHAAAEAAWNSDGNPVVILAQSATVQTPMVAPDGAGGAFVAWSDNRNGNKDIFVQRMSSAGFGMWAPNGVGVCTVLGDQTNPQIISDGAGGAYVCWEDARHGGSNVDIYLQRLTSSGQIASGAWVLDGVPVCTVSQNQDMPRLALDGSVGVLVAWLDRRTFPRQIFAQRFSGAGVAAWLANGVTTTPDFVASDYPGNDHSIVSDAAGGAIVGWIDAYGFVLGQRLAAADGARLWTWYYGAGLIGDDGFEVEFLPDGSGGVLISYLHMDYPPTFTPEILYKHLDGSGTPFDDGISAGPAYGDISLPVSVPDGFGGVVTAWYDDEGIRTQRLAKVGTTYALGSCWPASGRIVGPGLFVDHATAGDDRGGALVCFANGAIGSQDLFCQRVTAGGSLDPAFPAGGKVLSAAAGSQYGASVARTATGCVMAAWVDGRSGVFNACYAQQVTFDATQPAGLTTLTVPLTARTSAKLNWVVPSSHPQYGLPANFDVRYSLNPITEANFSSASPALVVAAQPPGTVQCQEVDFLGSCKTYYFAVRTRYQCGVWSLISNTPTGTTRCSGNTFVICDGGLAKAVAELPTTVEFRAPWPNPAERMCSMEFAVPNEQRGEDLEILVFDLAGRQVRSLQRGPAVAGRSRVEWDLRTDDGAAVAPGAYFVRFRLGAVVEKRTLIVKR